MTRAAQRRSSLVFLNTATLRALCARLAEQEESHRREPFKLKPRFRLVTPPEVLAHFTEQALRRSRAARQRRYEVGDRVRLMVSDRREQRRLKDLGVEDPGEQFERRGTVEDVWRSALRVADFVTVRLDDGRSVRVPASMIGRRA